MFKKLGEWFKGLFIKKVASEVIEYGSDYFEKFLDHLAQKDINTLRVWLSTSYIMVDTYLEDFVKTTKTDLDDEAVAELKEDIEKCAAKYNIPLLNLDEGTPND